MNNIEHKEFILSKVELLKAIAHPIRLCLIQRLCENERCNVTFFTNCMDASQSNISQHLGKLKDLGILGSEKEGQAVYYFIKNEEVRKIVEFILGCENE
ncbi:MAG: metalloregulator ArsR/SmtB family transcription factor [Eubacteriales bacterium]|nr:metalloregulator ArsR/SmtB family transcription factor [Eubacteriales bacterium]MDY3332887.1 metalloregulator ArsR/SmtB family transcription factor [Gallibacter sp.]